MADIYEQHMAAFSRVAAYVVLHDGKQVANVAIKYPTDGAGRLYAYVHWLGLEMTRGFAGGGGYDKASAAVANAVDKTPLGLDGIMGLRVDPKHKWNDFRRAARRDDGHRWKHNLELAGFVVVQAV